MTGSDRTDRRLRLLFRKPSWFIADAEVTVEFDGTELHKGSFKAGFDLDVAAARGAHEVSITLRAWPAVRRRDYVVEVGDAPAYVAEVEYSRLRGTFHPECRFEPATP